MTPGQEHSERSNRFVKVKFIHHGILYFILPFITSKQCYFIHFSTSNFNACNNNLIKRNYCRSLFCISFSLCEFVRNIFKIILATNKPIVSLSHYSSTPSGVVFQKHKCLHLIQRAQAILCHKVFVILSWKSRYANL